MISDRSTSTFVPAATSSTLATGNGHPKMIIPSDNNILPYYHKGNQQQRQLEKRHQREDHRGSTKSIEMLAMISEQEINRRNSLGVGNVPVSTSFADATDASTSAVARSTSDDINSSNIDRNRSSTSAQTAILLEQSRQRQYQLAKQLELNSQLQSVNHEQQQNLQLLEAQHSSLNNHQQDTQRLQQTPMNIFHRQSVDNLNLDDNNKIIITTGDQNALGSRKNASTATARNLTTTNNNVCTTRRMAGLSYRDYSNEQPQPEERDCWALSTRTTSSPVFPLKLHETLTQIDKDGYDDIIGWLPHGRSFKIHKQKEFTDIILPRYVLYASFISTLTLFLDYLCTYLSHRDECIDFFVRYFVMTKKSSFLRQLNLYSFNRFSGTSPNKGSYYHEKFLRGKKFLTRRMTRQKVNGNRIRSAGNPEKEPDLSSYSVCRDDSSSSLPTSSSSSSSSSQIAIQNAPSPINTDAAVSAIKW
jgi:hypothetical protein